MDRLLFALGLSLLLACAMEVCTPQEDAQPVFFSLLFPQLMPLDGDAGEFWLFAEGVTAL